jgi:hypothetical protein
MADPTSAAEAVATSTASNAEAAATAPAETAHPKVKVRKHKQRSCNEKDAKGKLCAGHLKRWYDYPKELAALVGPEEEIYRCEFCKTLYRPDPEQLSNSFTLRY